MGNTFVVGGMTCGHCEMAVKKAIERLDAQAKVTVDRSTGKVEVQSTQTREAIAQAIADEGYQVT